MAQVKFVLEFNNDNPSETTLQLAQVGGDNIAKVVVAAILSKSLSVLEPECLLEALMASVAGEAGYKEQILLARRIVSS